MFLLVGSYVVHKKLAELGSGEIVKVEEGGIRIRFASGERLFSEALVGPHLEVTSEAPIPPPAPPGRKRAAKPKVKIA
jgi:hypothetical protein